MLEDESASTSHQARSAVADAIKTIVANKVHSCHGKRRDIVNLCPGWGLSMSLNNEPERMMILPRLTTDVQDKIVSSGQPDMRCRSRPKQPEEKAAFGQKIVGELPAYLHWLENEFEIPVEWRSSRFGVKEFQNPQLLESLDELSPATILLELIDQL